MASFAALALSAALASPIAPLAPSDTTPQQRVAPATSAVTTLRAADPERGQPAWTLRLARSETGLQCSTVGQVQDGAFGLVGLDGAFRAVPEANADACARAGDAARDARCSPRAGRRTCGRSSTASRGRASRA